MPALRPRFAATPLYVSVLFALTLQSSLAAAATAVALPLPPAGVGATDSAPCADPAVVPPYVDYAYTNQRGDARYATLATNAGVRVVSGFLDIWTPSTLLVDAGVSAPANGSFPAIVPSTWTGIPVPLATAPSGTLLFMPRTCNT